MFPASPPVDSVREEFIKLYNAILEEFQNESSDDLSDDERRDMRIAAMAESSMDIRTEMDPDMGDKLDDAELLEDLQDYLLAEYTPLGYAPDAQTANLFAEYILYCLLDNPTPEQVSIDYLKAAFSALIPQMTEEEQKELLACRDVFAWDVLYPEQDARTEH